MSSVDNRIVEMQFDNRQFESGVQTSIRSIETLKKGLDFDKSVKSLGKLKKAGESFSMEGMARNIEFVASKFTNLGIMGVTAMQRLSNFAIDAGKKIISALTIDPIKAGLGEYETQINAIQTILSNTRSKGTVMADVTKALDELNTYADKTIYNFTEMTRNIGTFTAAGVSLKESTSSIKGIANLAAVSGSNSQKASVAMYQLSQAIASGTVKLMDWNSVVNAGMGGQVFQDALMETARVHKVNIDGMLKTEGSFRETLKKGWLTSAILVETLSKFTGDLTKEQILAMGYTEEQAQGIMKLGQDALDAATKIKTFTQLVDTFKEVVGSGWTKSWELVVGNFEQARDLWTGAWEAIEGVLSASSDSRNSLLSKWNELGGRADLIEGLTGVFKALWSIVVSVGDAMGRVFPETTVDNLLSLSRGIKDLGRNLSGLFYAINVGSGYDKIENTIFGKIPEFAGELKKGLKGDAVKKLQEQLKELGYDIGATGADGIFGPKTEAALKKFQKDKELLISGIYDDKTHKSLIDALGLDGKESIQVEWLGKSFTVFSDTLQKIGSIAGGVFATFSIGWKVLSFLGQVAGHVVSLLAPLGNVLLTIGAAIGDSLVDFNKWLDDSGAFADSLEAVKLALEPLGKWLDSASQSILNFFGFGDVANKANGALMTFPKLWDKIVKGFKNTGIWDKTVASFEKLKKAVSDLGPVFQKYFGKIKEYLGEKFQALLEKVAEKIPAILEGMGNTLIWLFDFIEPYVQKIPEAFEWIKTAFMGLFDGEGPDGKKTPGFITKIKNFFTALWDQIKSSEHVQKAWNAVKGFLENAWDWLSGFYAKLFDSEDENGDKKPGVFTTIVNWLTELMNQVTGSKTLEESWEKLKTFLGDTWTKIKDFMGPFWDIIMGFFTKDESGEDSTKNTLEKVEEKFSIFTLISNAVKGIFGMAEDLLVSAFDSLNRVLDKIGVDRLIDVATRIMGAIATFRVMMSLAGFLSSIKKIGKSLASLTGTLDDIIRKKAFGRNKIQDISALFLSIALAIGALVASIWFLGTIDPDKLKQGAAYVGGIVTVLGILAIAASKITNKKAKSLANVGKSLMFMAAAVGILTASIWVLSTMSWGQLLTGGGALIGVMTILAVFSKLFSKMGDLNINMKGFIKLSIAIGLLAGMARLIGGMDQDKFWTGVVDLLGITTILALFAQAINLTGGAQMNFKGFIKLTIAIGLLAGIARLVGGMDQDKFNKGVLGVFNVSMVLLTFSAVLTKLGGSQMKLKGILGISAAIAILSGVVILLGRMDNTTLAKGIGALAGVSAILAGLVFVLGSYGQNINTGSTLVMMLGLVAIMATLGIVMTLIRGIDPAVMLSFAGSLAIALAALVGAILIVNKAGGGHPIKSMAGGAAGIGAAIGTLTLIITGIVTALGAINEWTNKGFEDTINSGADVLKAVGKALGSLAAGITESLTGTDELDSAPATMDAYSTTLEAFTAALDHLRTTLGLALLAATGIGAIPGGVGYIIAGSIGLGVSVAILTGFVTSVVAALGGINEWTDNGFLDTLTSGGDVLEKAGIAIGKFVGGIKQGFVSVTDLANYTKDLQDYGAALDVFTGAVEGLSSKEGLDDDVTSALEVSKKVKEFFDKIVSYVIDPENIRTYNTAAGQLSADMSAFGTAISDFRTGVTGLGDNETLPEDTDVAIDIARTIYKFFASLKLYKIDRSGIEGYVTAPDQLSSDMTKFGTAIKDYASKVVDLPDKTEVKNDTATAIEVATEVKGFFDKIGDSTISQDGLIQYNNQVDGLFGRMVTFSKSITDFQGQISGIAKTNIIADTLSALASAKSIALFLSWLPALPIEETKGALQTWFTTESKTDTVISQIGRIGDSMRDFQVGVSGFGKSTIVSDTAAMKNVMEQIIRLLTWISSDSVALEQDIPDGLDTTFTKVITQLGRLSGSISSFDEDTKSIDTNRLSIITSAIQAIVASLVAASKSFEDGSIDKLDTIITKFFNLLSGEGETKLDTSKFLEGLDSEKISTALTTFTKSVGDSMTTSTDTINGYVDSFNTAGSGLASAINAGVGSGSTDTSGADKMVSGILSAISESNSDFERAGFNMGRGLASGLRRSTEMVKIVAAALAKAMLQAAKDALGIKSPSKEFAAMGENAAKSLAKSLTSYSHVVSKAGTTVGAAAFDSTKETLFNLASLVNDNMDVDPVIRPVVDLSSVTSGARAIDSMLSRRTAMSIDTVRGRELAASVNMPRHSGVQNGSNNQNDSSSMRDSGGVVLTGNNFYVRNESDARLLAQEIAYFTNQERRSYGMATP